MGTENVTVFWGTKGRAEGSSIPITARGCLESISRYGYCTIVEHPEPKGAYTTFLSVSSKRNRVNNPERTSGSAKKITTSGPS